MTTHKLNPEAKAKWVAALRSGKYTQGRKTLRTVDDEFCCLGVAEDIFRNEWKLVERGDAKYWVSGEFARNIQTEKTAEILGFRRGEYSIGYRVPVVSINGIKDVLWRMNDTHGFTFEQIADAIQEQL